MQSQYFMVDIKPQFISHQPLSEDLNPELSLCQTGASVLNLTAKKSTQRHAPRARHVFMLWGIIWLKLHRSELRTCPVKKTDEQHQNLSFSS